MATPPKPVKPFFLFNTSGDWMGVIIPPYIYDPRGDSIGFVEGTACFTFDGEWVGDVTKDGRIIRKRAGKRKTLHPKPLPRIKGRPANMPARAPLPPQNAEIGYDSIDVLEEEPDIFKRVSDRRQDLGENTQ